MIKFKKFFQFSIIGIILFLTKKSLAVCPLCVVAVAGGIELSRWLKIDDLITGLWIGGLIVALIYWTIDFLNKKGARFWLKEFWAILFWYVLIFGGLSWSGISSQPISSFSFLNKINLGIILGSLGFWFGAELYTYLKEKNNGRAYFPFQKVVMPILPLLILSIIFYLILK
ncbi:MAG: hypothetical protein ACPL3E_02235 [Minisyncoccia bacterium]